jgi:DNA topoisomerase-1
MDLGMKVNDFLVAANFCFIDLSFTADMEEKLDEISNGKLEKVKALSAFWDRLKHDLENAKVVKSKNQTTTFKCPACEKKGKESLLLIKHSKFGMFMSCTEYSNKEDQCTYTCKIGPNGEPVEKAPVVLKESEFDCPNCGKKLIIRTSKKSGSEYLGCRNWTDKNCAGFYSTDGKKYVKKNGFKKWKNKKNSDEE